jgi:hypothetical protein
MKYAIILCFSYTPAWLEKSRAQRKEIEERAIHPLFAKYADKVKARFFDCEAFQSRFSDFVLFECRDLKPYYYLLEELRDSALIAGGYATIQDIFMGIEDGYREFERDTAKA